MTFMELIQMSDADQTKWVSEHSAEDYKSMLNEFIDEVDRENRDFRIKSFRDRLEAYEIAKAVMKGHYYGVTSDGKPWRIDFNDPHDEDWCDDYLHTDYMY